MEQVTLYFRQGSSDKVYQASIEQQNGGYLVNFAFGRRGTTLQTGTKTQSPVSSEEAKRIFDKLVNDKTAKGYTPGKDGTPYQHTDKKKRATLSHACNHVRDCRFRIGNVMKHSARRDQIKCSALYWAGENISLTQFKILHASLNQR
jgi:predicted DNA-binding WGR domain protein